MLDHDILWYVSIDGEEYENDVSLFGLPFLCFIVVATHIFGTPVRKVFLKILEQSIEQRSIMAKKSWICILVFLCMNVVSCSTPQFFTVTIFDSPSRNVRLQTMPVMEEGQAYSHPAYISEEQMKNILQGLYVQEEPSAFERALLGQSGQEGRRRAFSDREVKFFAPLLVKGLEQATPEEIVTFFETAEISDLHEATTSGGVFVKDDAVHILLSNHSVKTQIWQDNDEYQAPYRLNPLEPIDPEPGQIIFEPKKFMVQSKTSGWFETLKGKPWHAAVSYKDLPQ